MDIQVGDIIMDKNDNLLYLIRDVIESRYDPSKKILMIADIDAPETVYGVGEAVIEREFQKISWQGVEEGVIMYHSKNHYEVGDMWKVKQSDKEIYFVVLEVDKDIGIRVREVLRDRHYTVFNGSRFDVDAVKVA